MTAGVWLNPNLTVPEAEVVPITLNFVASLVVTTTVYSAGSSNCSIAAVARPVSELDSSNVATGTAVVGSAVYSAFL